MPEQVKNPDGAAPSDASSEMSSAHVQPRKRRGLRAALFVLGPALVFIGAAYFYLNTGRYAATENAYVKSDTVLVSAEVSGPIVRIAVRENEPVQAGAVLFEIDAGPYQVKVDRAKAQVEAVESFIESLEASYRQQQEQLELARINVAYRERELVRQQELATRQLGTEVDIDDARHELAVAEQQIPIIEQALAQLRAQIGGQIAPGLGVNALFDGNAAFRTVKSMLESAELDLAHTVVRAPFAGIVGRVPAVGHYVAPGSPVMSLVADGAVWIEANYKETELTHVEPGQPVAIRIDTYPDHEWTGTVESISPATGSEFAVIPAQNASGNWVKVAQRIPVRISVRARPGDPPLRAGMSAVVAIDTGFERAAPNFLSFLRVSRAAESGSRAARN